MPIASCLITFAVILSQIRPLYENTVVILIATDKASCVANVLPTIKRYRRLYLANCTCYLRSYCIWILIACLREFFCETTVDPAKSQKRSVRVLRLVAQETIA